MPVLLLTPWNLRHKVVLRLPDFGGVGGGYNGTEGHYCRRDSKHKKGSAPSQKDGNQEDSEHRSQFPDAGGKPAPLPRSETGYIFGGNT